MVTKEEFKELLKGKFEECLSKEIIGENYLKLEINGENIYFKPVEKMKEFNLSEKIKTKHEFNYQHQGFHSDPELLEVTDVKEFIRLLKEELLIFGKDIEEKQQILNKINKLVGDKLK